MDAKEFLKHIADNPPDPLQGGCVRIATRPLLFSLQIMGIYHEHGRFRDASWHSDRPAMHVWPPNAHQRKQVATRSMSQKSLSTVQGLIDTSVVSDHSSDATDKSVPILNLNENTCRSWNAGSVQHNEINLEYLTTGKGLPQFCSGTGLGTTAVNRFKTNDVHVSGMETSLERCGDFLTRCGMVDKRATRDIIKSLGYDLPSSYPVLEETKTEALFKEPNASFIRSLWSDRTYSFIVILLMWLYFFRFAVFLDNSSGINAMHIMGPCLWVLMIVSINTAFFVSCVRKDHFYTFYLRWVKLFNDPATRALGLRGVMTTTYIKTAVIILWILTVINISCMIFIMMMDDQFSAGMNVALYVTGQKSALSIGLATVILTYILFSWIAVVTFITAMCHVISSHFREFNQVMKLHIAAVGTNFPKSLALLRERHLAMCDTVHVLDRFVSVAIGFFYSITITTCCLLVYRLIYFEMDASVRIIATFWFASGMGLMAVVTYNMAGVNIAMHSVGDELYTLQTGLLTEEELCQLQMFLNKVNGPSMGFTVMGMITVTRELMLTLFGSLLTYAVVLLQFK